MEQRADVSKSLTKRWEYKMLIIISQQINHSHSENGHLLASAEAPEVLCRLRYVLVHPTHQVETSGKKELQIIFETNEKYIM